MKTKINTDTKFVRKIVTILGVRVDSTQKDELLKSIENKIDNKIQFVIVTPNPEIILEAQNDPELTHSLNSADFSVPDGIGLKLADKNLNIIKGRELMLHLFKLADSKKLKIYFFGSKREVISKTLNKIKIDFPHLIAKGNSGPVLDRGSDPVSEADSNLQFEIVKEINTFRPSILFIALGAPKQEIWINKHLKDLNAGGAMTVGGSLDYYSGFVKPVPKFLESNHLEWLWRLIQEPQRIMRIFNALVIFPFKLALDKVFHSVNN